MTITTFVLFVWVGFNVGLVSSKWFNIPDWFVTVSLWAAVIFSLVF